MEIKESDYLAHYGTLHKSGRYPWGSGGFTEGSTQRHKTLMDYIREFKALGYSDPQIAKSLGVTTTQFRTERSIELHERKAANISQVQRLSDHGNGPTAISRITGIPEPTVRSYLKPGEKEKADSLHVIADVLRQRVAEDKMIDVGSGVENYFNDGIGIAETKLKSAVSLLQTEGYTLHNLNLPQLTTGETTKLKTLCPPGMTWGEAQRNITQVRQIQTIFTDGGNGAIRIQPPMSIHPNRVGIRYGSEGGAQADGVIFVRPGVKDVSIGGSSYAQVRILVGKGHYIKGMAMYRDDLPPGVDLVFNTNKENTGNKLDVLKPASDDPANPFGAYIKRQVITKDAKGNDRVTSVMNIVREEGNWEEWSRTLSSQMLSKQNPKVAKTQLDMAYERRMAEFNRISSLTNPTVRRKLLITFGDATDKAALQLHAAGLPKQVYHAILPLSKISPQEVYAPNFNNGERVALVRFPHAGTFEIPDLIVNNRNPEGVKLLRDAKDAIGIHHTVAERLSGADFDGDAVLVILNDSGKVKITPALDGLKDFNPRIQYKGYPGMKVMANKQQEMGSISNLITDMTLAGASTEHLARAVRHSMVVIDAENHKLNYKQSAKDNTITMLKERYQKQPDGSMGASTLISRARAREYVPERKTRPAALGGPIDRETGKRVFVETGKIDSRTQLPRQTRSKRLAETDDAHTLSSGTPMEKLYADHANRLKELANRARREGVNTPPSKYSESAKKVYAQEVASLNAKLRIAVSNRPLERQAQVFGQATYRMKLDSNPNMDSDQKTKTKNQALAEARIRTGATKHDIIITPDEWKAIQAGAIAPSRLLDILEKADLKVVREHATPKIEVKMTSAKTARAQSMLDDGYTRAEVASALGVSLSTLDAVTNVED